MNTRVLSVLITTNSILPILAANVHVPRQLWNGNGHPGGYPPPPPPPPYGLDPEWENYGHYPPLPNKPPHGPPIWPIQGAPFPPGAQAQPYAPHADTAWGIIFGRGGEPSPNFTPIFSPTALSFIDLFDQCGSPSAQYACTDATICRMGIEPFCQLHGQPLKQFRSDLCNLGLGGVCQEGTRPGQTPAGTAFTWGLMVGGIRMYLSDSLSSCFRVYQVVIWKADGA